MTDGPVVSNSSPLIALQRIGLLHLLRSLFETVVVSPVVADEITPSLKVRLSWITVRPLAAHIEPRVLRATLDLGERDAISLAIEQSARLIILDDLAARKMAEGVGLPVVGTLGILVRAKQRGLLAAVQPNLDTLVAVGFYIGPDLRRRILSDAGEGGS